MRLSLSMPLGLIGLTLLLASPRLQAQQAMPARMPAAMPIQGQGGMPDAVRRVERETGGQVLNVESMRFQGREIHRVKVLEPGGRIRIVVDDPNGPDRSSADPAFRSTRGNDDRKP